MHRREVFFQVNLTAIRTFLCVLPLAGLAQPFSINLLCGHVLPTANSAGVLLNIIPDTLLDPWVRCLQLPLHKGIRKYKSSLSWVCLREINMDYNSLATGNGSFSKNLIVYSYTGYCHTLHLLLATISTLKFYI